MILRDAGETTLLPKFHLRKQSKEIDDIFGEEHRKLLKK